MKKHKDEKKAGPEEQAVDTTVAQEESAMIQQLQQRDIEIEELRRKVAEHEERTLRLQADFSNLRNRSAKQQEELSVFVTQNLIAGILPVLDNMERALTAQGDAEALREGMDMVYRQFLTILEKNGLQPVVAVGEIFDPARHEAVMRVEAAEQPDGFVLEEFQKGYAVHGKVVRPSMVKVVGNS